MKTTMKTLFQLGNRIAWEIQTLRDRQGKITEARDFLAKMGWAGEQNDRELAAEFARIEERIEALEQLDQARRTLKILRPRLAKAAAWFRPMLKDEIFKITSAVGQLRASLRI